MRFFAKTPKAFFFVVAAAALAACQNLAAPVSVTGGSQASAPLARFTAIQDIAVDGQDNLYVSDGQPDGAMSLQKISADGKVTQLGGTADVNAAIAAEGPLAKANLAGLRGMAVRGDTLYLTGNNCLRSVDLKASELSIKTHWGSCLTAAQLQQVQSGDTTLLKGAKPTLFNEHLLVTGDQTIYADVAGEGKHIFKLASGKTEPEKINYAYEVLGMSIDSQGNLFLSHPYPTADGPGYIEKWAPPQIPLRLYPGASQIITDSKDNLYFLDGTTLARYATNNRRTDIGRVGQAAPERAKVRLALNPGESQLYMSLGTEVYRFALPAQ